MTVARAQARGVCWILFAVVFLACTDQSVNVLTRLDAAPPVDASVDADVASDDVLSEDGDAQPKDGSSDGAIPPVDSTSELDVPSLDGPLGDIRADGALGDAPSSDGSQGDAPGDASFSDVPLDAPTVGCLAIGTSCSYAGSCCSLACPQAPSRVCASGPVCSAAGVGCLSNADCCANRCEGAFCRGVTAGLCRPAGEACASDGDCCGARCAPSNGALYCALVNGCRALGEICNTVDDCCSRNCNDDDRGVRVCVP